MAIDLSFYDFLAITFVLFCGIAVIIFLNVKYPYKFAYQRFYTNHKWECNLAFLCSVLVLALLIPLMIVFVPYGKAAVIWSRFSGGTQDEVFYEGAFYLNPLNKYYLYNIKYQLVNHSIEGITKEGLVVHLNVSARFRLYPQKLPELQSQVGPDYIKLLILPELGAWTRQVVSQYTAEELYTTKRLQVQNDFNNLIVKTQNFISADNRLDKKNRRHSITEFLELEQILLKGVVLPKPINKAINAKLSSFYLDQQYNHKIEIAKKEAQRKIEEAKGIAKFQEIVSGGISNTYLKWRGIEATLQLSKSNNAKVVVIGSGKDGLPIILNAEDNKGGAAK